MGIDHSNPYIHSTTVLCDPYIRLSNSSRNAVSAKIAFRLVQHSLPQTHNKDAKLQTKQYIHTQTSGPHKYGKENDIHYTVAQNHTYISYTIGQT